MTCVHCLRRKECAKQEKLMLTVDGIGEYTYQRNVEKDCPNFLDGDAALKLIKRQQAEIERLQKHNTEMAFKHHRDGAKEFAERLKNATVPVVLGGKYHYDVITKEGIDNLLAEMNRKENNDEMQSTES